MNSIFNVHLISELIKKLDLGKITFVEHNYLQKVIVTSILIQRYNKLIDEKMSQSILQYYNIILKIFNSNLDFKSKSEYFILKTEVEKYFLYFGKYPGEIEKISQFEQLKILASFWGYPLSRNREEVLNFLALFMEKFYQIPTQFIIEIQNFLSNSWRPILSPIAAISNKKFSFDEIEEYFFGMNNKNLYWVHLLPNADRLFSITNPQFKNHLFIPKSSHFDIFDAALVVHEFQHIQDSPKALEMSLFESEKNALQAERVFLNVLGTGKKGKYCWLESNLFYPLLLLKWELDIILRDDYDINILYEICRSHSLEPLNLSHLFDWQAPFQMSAYCAASMALEQNWKSALRNLS